MPETSIAKMPANEQAEYLKKSRLAQLITDKGVLAKICEAAVHLLTDPKLQECDESSIMGALYKAATMGFRLERDFGECHLIPRSLKVGDKWVKTCSFQIGYKGWKALALQSGYINSLEAHEVYTADKFEFKYGTAAFLNHEPAERNDGKMSHFYALAKLKTGDYVFSVINIQDAEKSRRNSDTQYRELPNSKQKAFEETAVGVWAKNYAPMALRVPIKKVCSALPLTPAIENAIQNDGGVTYLQKNGTITTVQPADVEASAEQLPDNPAQLPANVEKPYDEFSAILGQTTDFDKVLEMWASQDATTPQMMYGPFLQLFFGAGARTATTGEQLDKFLEKTPSAWKKSPRLVAILSRRKSEIENGRA